MPASPACNPANPPDALPGRKVEAPPPYVDAVGASDEAVARPLQAVTAGVSGIVEKVQQVLSFYEVRSRGGRGQGHREASGTRATRVC